MKEAGYWKNREQGSGRIRQKWENKGGRTMAKLGRQRSGRIRKSGQWQNKAGQ